MIGVFCDVIIPLLQASMRRHNFDARAQSSRSCIKLTNSSLQQFIWIFVNNIVVKSITLHDVCLRSAQNSRFCIMTSSCQRSAQRVDRLTMWAKVACLQFVTNLFVLFERNIIITLVYMEYNELVYIVWKYNSPKNGVLTCLWCLINIIIGQKIFLNIEKN